MADNRLQKVVVAGGSAVALAAVMSQLLAKRAEAAPGETVTVTLDPLIEDLLVAMAQQAVASGALLAQLLEAVRDIRLGGITVLPAVPNTAGIRSFRVVCAVANRGYQLLDSPIPDDMELIVKAWHLNGGLIYVGRNRADAENPNTAYPLLANESIGYRVKNADSIWISATVAGEFVSCTSEQR